MDFRLVHSLIERLPFEPNSLLGAKLKGNKAEHFGWGVGEYQNANLIDAVNLNTSVTQVAGTKKRPKVPKPSFRPGAKNVRQLKPKSIKDMKNIQLRG